MEQQNTHDTPRGRRARRRAPGRPRRGEIDAVAAAAAAPSGRSPWAEPREPLDGVTGAAASIGAGSAVIPGGLVGGYRIVRRIAVGARAQVYLAVPDAADGAVFDADATVRGAQPAAATAQPVALRVYGHDIDDETVTVELEAYSALGGGALPRAFDVFTLPDGRVCLVVEPVMGERLAGVLEHRRLSPGEAVTALAPIVAAVGALARAGFALPGLSMADVRFDATGRPRLTGLGQLVRLGPASADRTAEERRAHAALVDLLVLVIGASAPSAALARVADLARARLDARPFEPFALALEQELFRAAVAAPVNGAGEPRRPPTGADAPRLAPSRAGFDAVVAPDPGVALERHGRGSRATSRRREREPERNAAIGELLAAETPLLGVLRLGQWRERVTQLVARRRGAVVVGALTAAAASVLLLTLVPPERGASAERGAPTRSAASTATPMPIPEPGSETGGTSAGEPDSESGSAPAGDGEDYPAIAAELLEIRESCLAAADRECLAEVVQPGSALESADRVRIAEGGAQPRAQFELGTIAVAGTMGGAVLLDVEEVGADSEPASLLMMRSEAGWRLRELFD